VPGTVIDTRDLEVGGTFIYKADETAFPPNRVRQAESKLVDNMVPLSYVMVGTKHLYELFVT
jgi:hypothetical protein